MRLLHYSNMRLDIVHSVEQVGELYDWHDGRKPVGLWVSVDGENDWRAWCEAEDFLNLSEQLAHEIILRDNHRVLIVDSFAAMVDFHQLYGIKIDGRHGRAEYRVDWPRVARDQSGIIIAPYRGECRLGHREISDWYHTWDCASGCIWDAAAVAQIIPAKPEMALPNLVHQQAGGQTK